MMKYTCLTLIFLLAGCHTRRLNQRTEQDSSSRQLRRSEQRDSLLQVTTTGRLLLSNRNQLEYTEIIPSGAFTYTADSGFSGSASRIRVLRDSRQQTLQRDSGNQVLQTGRKADSLEKAQSRNRQSRQAQEKESQPGYHSYLLPAGIFLLAGLLYLRYFRKR